MKKFISAVGVVCVAGSLFAGSLGASDVVFISGTGGSVRISLAGATIVSYTPCGGKDVFFKAYGFLAESKAFPHGGLPLAWPWFGRRDGSNDINTIHGFARNLRWEIQNHSVSNAILSATSSAETRNLYPYDFKLVYSIDIGAALSVALEMTNTGTGVMPVGAGFHPFFRVSNNTNVVLSGCEGVSRLASGTDMDCPPGTGRYLISDCETGRRIEICATGTDGVCVWNDYAQWPEVYAKGGGTEFCCVEPILCGTDGVGVRLNPGQSAKISMSIRVLEDREVR